MRIVIIYKITINDEFYIGSSCNFSRRIIQHRECLSNVNSCKYNLPLYKYIRENGGIDNCKWDIIDVKYLDDNSLNSQKILEQSFIDALKPSLNTHSAFQPYKNKKEYDKIRYEKSKSSTTPS
tara:strand:- start:65 stop:433 length:369 start_codon:yes stop_codon:yes gene_type:complete